MFDLQVRYALGYENLGDGCFAIRTVYHFQERLSQHMTMTGENLMEQAVIQITDAQVEAVRLYTNKLCVDSTQLASNIRNSSRLQLLLETLKRVARMLCADDRERYAELLGLYVKGEATHCIYGLKSGQYGEKVAQIGGDAHRASALGD